MAQQSNGTAHWEGDLKTGKGTMSTGSPAVKEARYGFNSRFTGGEGTNPEEMIAMAHSGCFSMAASMIMGESDITPDAIDTKAIVTLEEKDAGFRVTKSHLDVKVKAKGADKAAVEKALKDAKEGCPISNLLDCEITMDTSVEV